MPHFIDVYVGGKIYFINNNYLFWFSLMGISPKQIAHQAVAYTIGLYPVKNMLKDKTNNNNNNIIIIIIIK